MSAALVAITIPRIRFNRNVLLVGPGTAVQYDMVIRMNRIGQMEGSVSGHRRAEFRKAGTSSERILRQLVSPVRAG